MPASQDSTKSQILTLAAVTYGTVILTAVVALWVYFHFWGKTVKESDLTDHTGSIAVGTLWVPVFPGALLEGQTSDTSGGVTRSTFRLRSSSVAHEMLEFYKARLKTSPYRFTNAGETPQGGTVFATAHQGKATVFVTVRATDSGSHAEITAVER